MDAVATSPILVGIVNSMPGQARRHTENQFRTLLNAAAQDVPVQLRFFTLEPSAGDDASPAYEGIEALEEARPDGLIVTGMPPRATHFPDEAYWPAMVRLIEWTQRTGMPTVWSCLAAHAAVFHLDGLTRQPFPAKLSGLITCTRTDANHPAMRGLPRHWQVPHSRYNDVPEMTLRARGYHILSRTAAHGADIFAKDAGAPFLFCQGHPEYDADTLLREYQRDIRQYLSGGRADYPEAPQGCFGASTLALLDRFRARALCERDPALIDAFPAGACRAELSHGWRDMVTGLYANWLGGIVGLRARRRVGPRVTSLAGRAARPQLRAVGERRC